MRTLTPLALLLSMLLATSLWAASFSVQDTAEFPSDDRPAVQQLLKTLAWTPRAFECHRLPSNVPGAHAEIYFPQAHLHENHPHDLVVLDFFGARDRSGRALSAAPAVLLVHSLHPQMELARGLARLLNEQSIHAFVIQMPGYGHRHHAGDNRHAMLLDSLPHSLTDIRRARDVIAALPEVDGQRIALAGVSMGGFLAASAAALEPVFNPVFLILSGARAAEALIEGRQDAALARSQLAQAGWPNERIASYLHPFEPQQLAHRLQPAATWLVMAELDEVVFPSNSMDLARAIDLPEARILRLNANHYTAVFFLPAIANQITLSIQQRSRPTQ